MELRVGIDHAHKRHVLEVEPLRDHLRSQKHGGVRSGELLEEALVGSFAARGVGVHADDGHTGADARHPVEQCAQLRLDTLGSRAELLQVRASALGADGGRDLGVPAMVAHEHAAALVIGERGVARGAGGHEPAIAAQEELREAALVQEKHRLAPEGKLAAKPLDELAREHRPRSAAKFRRHVYDLDRRQGLAIRAIGQVGLRPAPTLLASIERLDGGRGRPHDEHAARASDHPARHVARIIARGGILLVGAFVFLVDHDEPDVRKRREQGASRPHHNARRAAFDEVPLVVALALAHARVHDRNHVAEATAEAAHRLRSERDLGHEHAGRAPLGKRLLDGAQVELRFA